MFPWFEYLPIELHEKILSLLSGIPLLIASKVCRLWLLLCGRIAKEKYKNIIPSECIYEIKEEAICRRESVWLKALRYHHQQQLFIDNSVNYEVKFVILFNLIKHTCYDIYGSLLFLGTAKGKVIVYDAEISEKSVLIIDCGKDSIQHLNVIKSLKLLFVGTTKYEFYSLPNLEEKHFEMKKLQVSADNDLMTPTDIPLSVSGTLLAVVTNPLKVTVFRLEMEKEDTVILKFFKKFETELMIRNVAIWNKEVLIILHSGEIIKWLIISDEFSKSQKYSEICYPNRMWIFRNRIFCSASISRKLLGLWHIEMGTTYWLMGKPNANLVRCRSLKAVLNNEVNEVLCIYLKQRLLFCGTNNGEIFIYYLSDSFFDNEAKEIDSNENIKTEFDRFPDFIVELHGHSIRDLKADFTEDKILIFTWPSFEVVDQPYELFIQCIEISEKDLLDEDKIGKYDHLQTA